MIKFYNTLTRSLDEFKPLNDNIVTIYSCGPTVYDYAHIGNFRSYIFADILRRFLKYKGYKVVQVMNITDIDDKTIKGSRESGISLKEWTKKYIEAFFEDLDKLNIERVEYYPKATEHISDMIELIKKIEKNGYTYEKDGSVYFRISKFKEYGKLSRIDFSGIKEGARVDVDEYNKEDAKDFVLWKRYKEGEPYWDTIYGKGRPGWHIECSTMSMKYLGETIDIHTGGVDLIFPHHENEIAQSESATGKQFVRFWLHCEHLIVNGEKMSKSKGNFYTLRDLIQKGFSPTAIRYLLLSVHYRSQLNFTFESLNAASQAVNKIRNFYNIVRELKIKNNKDFGLQNELKKFIINFEKEIENDLNISPALAEVFEFIRTANKFIDEEKITEDDRKFILNSMENFDKILGILDFGKNIEELPDDIKKLIEERQIARKNKDYKKADEIRERLKNMGIVLEDTKDGVRYRKIF